MTRNSKKKNTQVVVQVQNQRRAPRARRRRNRQGGRGGDATASFLQRGVPLMANVALPAGYASRMQTGNDYWCEGSGKDKIFVVRGVMHSTMATTDSLVSQFTLGAYYLNPAFLCQNGHGVFYHLSSLFLKFRFRRLAVRAHNFGSGGTTANGEIGVAYTPDPEQAALMMGLSSPANYITFCNQEGSTVTQAGLPVEAEFTQLLPTHDWFWNHRSVAATGNAGFGGAETRQENQGAIMVAINDPSNSSISVTITIAYEIELCDISPNTMTDIVTLQNAVVQSTVKGSGLVNSLVPRLSRSYADAEAGPDHSESEETKVDDSDKDLMLASAESRDQRRQSWDVVPDMPALSRAAGRESRIPTPRNWREETR